jgi:glycosyltransferase involved in cell wall biosynthesis
MKICFVTNNLRYFLSHRFDLAVELSKKYNHKIYVITSIESSTEDQLLICKQNNVNLISLDERSPYRTVRSYISDLKKILKREDFECIFFVTLELSFFGALIILQTKLKKCFFIISGVGHNFYSPKLKYKFIKFIQLLSFKASTFFGNVQFVVQNPDDRKILAKQLRISLAKFKLIKGNGINIQKFPYSEREFANLNFCYAGRATYSKGIHTLIEAMQLLKEKLPNVHFKVFFCILTDNNPSKDTINLDSFFAEQDNQLFECFYNLSVEELTKIFYKSSIYILPSEREGISKAALEAASTGLPILASDAIGSKESVNEEVNGLRFKTGDPIDLSKQLYKMIQSKEKLKYFSNNSRKLIEEEYSVVAIAQAYNDLFYIK